MDEFQSLLKKSVRTERRKNMTKEEMKDYVGKGLEASKNALKKGAEASKSMLDKAGKAAVKFGDESVLRIEIKQLESQIKKDTALLGNVVSKAFLEDSKDCVSKEDEEIRLILDRIRQTKSEIAEKEGELKIQKG